MTFKSAINDEAIQALKNLKTGIEAFPEKINTEITKLKSSFDTNKSELGPHVDSISQLLEDVGAEAASGEKPVKKLVRKLTTAEMIRQQILDNDRYSAKKR